MEGVTVRNLQDVWIWLMQQIDPTVLFDADSFYYFNNKTGETCVNSFVNELNPAYPVFESNLPYKDMVIMPLSDAVNVFTGTIFYRSTKSMLCFNVLWKFFEDKGFFWYLDSSNYFRLKHYTELSQADQAVYLASVQRKQEIEYSQPTYFKVHNIETGSSLDMKGVDTEFSNINSVDKYDYGQNQIHVDIDDIQILGTNGYSDDDPEQFVILTIDYVASSIRYIRDPIGLITGEKKHNAELGFPYIQKNLFSKVPDATAKINGLIETLADNRLDKTATVKLEIPFVDIDFTKNLFIFGKSCEIISSSQKSDGYKMELTVKSL
jgi:hypothetical protein